MNRLTAADIRGIWIGVTMCWREDYSFDESTYAANIGRAIASGVHGVYTTGSTGEFYAIDYEEFRRMVDIQAELCGKAGMPLQIGCCSDASRKTIHLLEYAATKEAVGAVQVNIPYWMPLTDKELLQFFRDLHTACPEMPLVHYNIDRAKRYLNGNDYLRILEVAPNLVGVKFTGAGSNFGVLQDSLRLTPNLSYFVGENMLASAMQLGARGSYSSLVATDPAFMLEMYALASARRWDDAIRMQKRIAQFFSEWEAFVEATGDGMMDPVGDKGLGVASGFLQGHQRCRPPYIGWSDSTVAAVRQWLQKAYPEFVYKTQSARA